MLKVGLSLKNVVQKDTVSIARKRHYGLMIGYYYIVNVPVVALIQGMQVDLDQ